jgi:Response regulator of the LytR/AlgR family
MEERIRADKALFVKTGATIKRVQSKDILYIQCEGNVSTLHLRDGKQMSSVRLLKLIEQDLAGTAFLRINHNCLANLDEVEEIRYIDARKRQLILSDGTALDVSYRKWKAAKEALLGRI